MTLGFAAPAGEAPTTVKVVTVELDTFEKVEAVVEPETLNVVLGMLKESFGRAFRAAKLVVSTKTEFATKFVETRPVAEYEAGVALPSTLPSAIRKNTGFELMTMPK